MAKKKESLEKLSEKFIRDVSPDAAVVATLKDGNLMLNIEGSALRLMAIAAALLDELKKKAGPLAVPMIMSRLMGQEKEPSKRPSKRKK